MTSVEISSKPTLAGARLLIVDDEWAVRHTLTDLFESMGYRVDQAASGPEALEQIARQPFDLVILDLKMPGMDGAEVLETARPLAPETVFIILTAYGTLESAITGIRQGAFDYLLKPSPVKEIVRVVEAGLAERQRRLRHRDPIVLLEKALTTLKSSAQPAEMVPALDAGERFLKAPDLAVDTFKRLAVVRGQPVHLTPTEFDILTYLLGHQDRVVSCRELVAHLRGYDLDERDARVLVRSHIRRLRHKVERDPAQPRLVRTVRGRGYLASTREANPP
jgi:two-component system KDP operon response regulator KdpE